MTRSLNAWWRRREDQTAVREDGPNNGPRIYAVGDIHGRADLLRKMQELISADLENHPCKSAVEVYIGDYVDRGPNTYDVVEILSAMPPLCNRRVCLMGNHEKIFLDFMEDPQIMTQWMSLGGLETLLSYGVRARLNPQRDEVIALHAELIARIPASHRRFLQELKLSFALGNYLFVHAGVRPGVKLADQRTEDLLWIREPFLTSTRNFGAIVVHGHTPGKEPVVLPNRICIDTGAYVTGILTCLVLDGQNKRFLTAMARRAAA